MKLLTLSQSIFRHLKKRPILWGTGTVALIIALAVWFKPSKLPAQALSCYDVKRGDFLISVVEGGTLEAVNEVSIRSEVEGIAASSILSRKAVM